MGNVVKGKSVIESYKVLEAACADLRHEVEHQGAGGNIVLLGPTYRATDPNAVKTVKVDGIEVGYLVKATDRKAVFARVIFVKAHGYNWSEIPDHDKDRILAAVMDGCLDEQKRTVIDLVSPTTFRIIQLFDVAYQVERNPDLIERVRGLEFDKDGRIIQ